MTCPSKIVVAHDVADFDALAAQVLARRLHPGAAIAGTRNVAREVSPYLALHRDRLELCPVEALDLDAVTELIVVDTRTKSRLRHVDPLLARRAEQPASLRVTLYDHHAARDDDLTGDVEVVARVGAVTTLLLERLQSVGGRLDPIEATLAALAIHADTGSLTFQNATARDAAALAWVMEQGASSAQLNRYLQVALSAAQREAFAKLFAGVRRFELSALRVAVAALELELAPSGLDEVTARCLETLGDHLLVAVYATPDGRRQVVARSRSERVDVGRVLQAVGGGGHAGAGSASCRDVDLAVLEQRLIDAIFANVRPARRVAEVMSSPAFCVSPEASLEEVAVELERLAHSGACVTNPAGELVGIVSRRDLARARSHRPDQRLVKNAMSRELETTTADAALAEALAQLERANVGRLPVVRDGRPVGVISRSDLIAALYAPAR